MSGDVREQLLIVKDEIFEGWNQIPLLALCRFYDKENLIDIVRLLIDKNIEVNCKTKDGWNALHLVCEYYNKENLIDVVRLLIDKYINVHCKTNDGLNSLNIVCRYYDKENLIDIVQFFKLKKISTSIAKITTDGMPCITCVEITTKKI